MLVGGDTCRDIMAVGGDRDIMSTTYWPDIEMRCCQYYFSIETTCLKQEIESSNNVYNAFYISSNSVCVNSRRHLLTIR